MAIRKIILLILGFLLIIGCQVQEAPQPDVPVVEEVVLPPPEEVQIVPSISLVDFPTTVTEGEQIVVTWKINSETPLTTTHTAIHYDQISRPGDLGTEVGPTDSGYKSLTRNYAQGQFVVPDEFSTDFLAREPGKIYLRAHTIINGNNYWTDEASVLVQKFVAPPPQVIELVIEGDDRGLYPDPVTVEKGEIVKITFKVREKFVYFGGLDFRSNIWGDTGKILPGESTTVEFTADKSFKYRSYWPATNDLKATGEVIVE